MFLASSRGRHAGRFPSAATETPAAFLSNEAGLGDTALPMRSLPHDPRKLLAIYLGGVAGALIRVGLAEAAAVGPGQWPWPTFVVNMAGALLLGWFYALFADRPEESLRHPFLATGICGT